MSAPAHHGPHHFELLVIGSGPAGRRAAITGAQLGAHTGLVERSEALGGTATHTGTLLFRTLRAAAMDAAAAARSRYRRVGDGERSRSLPDLLWLSLIHI